MANVNFSISVNTREGTVQNSGVSNLEFCCMIIFYEMATIFLKWLMSIFPFPLTLEKAESQTGVGVVIWNFDVGHFFVK